MKYGCIKGLNKPVSRLVLGTHIMNTGQLDQSFGILDAAFEMGITVFDTAHAYGNGESERVLGKWIKKRGNREKVVIISKGAHHNADRNRVTPFDITSDLYDSLARLKTDSIDLYLLHRDDPEVPVGPIVEVLNEHLKSGRIKAFGGSNWRHERIQIANDYASSNNLVPFTASSPHYSLADQMGDPWGKGSVAISGPMEAAARAWYTNNQMPVFAYSSLARGLFSGKITRENYQKLDENYNNAALINGYCYEENFRRFERVQILSEQKSKSVPQIALAFVLNQPMDVYPIIGAANREELRSSIEAMDIVLELEELAWLDLQDNRNQE